MQCFQDKYYFFKDPPSQRMDWQDVDILVVIDMSKNKIKVFSNAEPTYDIILFKGEITNANGDREAGYTCVDEDGIKCTASLVAFVNQDENARHVGTLTIEYKNIVYYFRLKRDD